MRFFAGVSAAFSAGILIGMGIGALLSEEKARKKYEESIASHRRAMEMSRQPDVKAEPKDEPKPKVEPETVLLARDETVKVIETTSDTHDFTPLSTNPYHTAVDDPNDTRPSFTFLTEDDYFEDDGRVKNQIIILMDDENPIFIENGGEIRDWETKIGSHILRDMYTMCPPGQKPVLYIRNNTTDEDYEVSREQP